MPDIHEWSHRHRARNGDAVLQVRPHAQIAAREHDLVHRNRHGPVPCRGFAGFFRTGVPSGFVRVITFELGRNATGEIERISKPRISFSPPMIEALERRRDQAAKPADERSVRRCSRSRCAGSAPGRTACTERSDGSSEPCRRVPPTPFPAVNWCPWCGEIPLSSVLNEKFGKILLVMIPFTAFGPEMPRNAMKSNSALRRRAQRQAASSGRTNRSCPRA